MDSSTLQLTVIYTFCALFLTAPYGSRLSENAASTAAPIKCYGVYSYERKIGYNANGATPYRNENTLEKCKVKCSQITCSSFDYNYQNTECWIHSSNVENSLRYVGSGIDHFFKINCPSTVAPSTLPTSTIAPSTAITTGGTAILTQCINNYQYDDFPDTYVLGGIQHSHNTLLACLQACSNSPLTGNNACTAVDFNSANECWMHKAPADGLARKTGAVGSVAHYVRESCAPTTPTTTSAGPTSPSPNAFVSFRVLFTNDYDATVRDVDSFIKTFRTEFCDDTGVRCARLLKPQMAVDVRKVTVKDNPGPQIGSIEVIGMLSPGEADESNTESVMKDFESKLYENFRHRLGTENDNIRLKPDTAEDYSGFTWERMETTLAPVAKEEEEGPLGLKLEYWILIGLGALALVVTIVAIVVICCLRQSNSESSASAQKKKKTKKEEQERKKQEKEDKKKAEKEKKEREKEEKEQKKKDKKDKDVEKGEEENQYQEPDVVPTKTDDSPSGPSDDDKAY